MEGFRILVVDDEDDFRDTLVQRLQNRKMDVTGAENGERALELIDKFLYDVVILDVKMPGLDGIQVLREIGKRRPSIEVIRLTGHASMESGIEGMKLGAFDFVMKPAVIDELMAVADVVISKPGGLTSAETLARSSVLAIVNPIPGQESRNSDYDPPQLRRGYELIEEADFLGHAPRVAREAVEKVHAPAVDAGSYDLVLDPEHLSLTMHESCGHPSELDRALGYEANYAGTSFLTTDKLGSFRYGSSHVNLVADNTEPETLAATEYYDDGVACQKWNIVREGLFVGYCTNREVAPKIGEARSRGTNRADSWGAVPIVRIASIGLEPGRATVDHLIAEVKRGIYIEGHGSYSIDLRRYNFQFGGDAFWLIENGKRTHMLRDVIYHGITPEFWNRCDGVADRSHRRRYGFITCGKGQPGQSGWMTHAASHARFRNIQVIRGEGRS